MLTCMEAHDQNSDVDRVNELIKVIEIVKLKFYFVTSNGKNSFYFFFTSTQGNMQRSKIVSDSINEARVQILKVFDHKSHVSDIIHRCASKRNLKKREKS